MTGLLAPPVGRPRNSKLIQERRLGGRIAPLPPPGSSFNENMLWALAESVRQLIGRKQQRHDQ